jgi:hypothetical protein
MDIGLIIYFITLLKSLFRIASKVPCQSSVVLYSERFNTVWYSTINRSIITWYKRVQIDRAIYTFGVIIQADVISTDVVRLPD